MAALLVPGTGAITLLDQHDNDVGWPVLMRLKGVIRGLRGQSDDELFELMAMEHRAGQAAPAKSSLKPGVTLRPGSLLRVAYNQVEDFNVFHYDWRADLRYSAEQLFRFLSTRRPADGRWDLVGHSQGGLVIIMASKLAGRADEFAQLVSTVTLVGAPVAGTLNAARAMIIGDNAGKQLAPVIRRTVRTWPAIYQMLPSWRAVASADGAPLADALQLKEPGGWDGFDDVQADLLLRAREVQADLAAPLSHMEGVDVRFFWARNRETEIAMRSPGTGEAGYEYLERTMGDSLVPYSTTMRWLGSSITPSDHVTAFGRPCFEHAYLFNDPTVVSHIRERLQ